MKKGTILKVTEHCEVEGSNNIGLRVYQYESSEENFEKALVDFVNNFDTDNIISSNDDFEEGCLDSEVVKIEKVL